jgi:hypothetical protein
VTASLSAQSETLSPKQKATDPETATLVKASKESRPVKMKPTESAVAKDPSVVKAKQAVPPVEEKKSAPTLSWQCFNALMYTGPVKLPEGAISMTTAVRKHLRKYR